MSFWNVSKRTIKTAGSVIFLTALIHIAVMTFNAIYLNDLKVFNYFRVLSLDVYFPKITKGYLSDLISLLVMALLFLVFWFFKREKGTNLKTK